MKQVLALLAWSIVAMTLLYAVFSHEHPLIDQGPGVMLSLGLIGLGSCRAAQQRVSAGRE